MITINILKIKPAKKPLEKKEPNKTQLPRQGCN